MTQICEHEDIHCPYCHSDGVKEIAKGQLRYDLRFVASEKPRKRTAFSGVPVHVLECDHCHSVFSVSCED